MAGTLVSLLVAAGVAAWYLARRSGRPPLALAVAWLALAMIIGYATWRGVRPAIVRFAALPVEEARAAGGVWRAPDLDGRRAGMIVNLAEAARTHQAQIESPSGPTLGPNFYADVRQLVVSDTGDPDRGAPGTSRREWLFLHPPAQVSVTLDLPTQGQPLLQAALALDPAAWETPLGDGVEYQALVAPVDASGRTREPAVVLARVVNPRANREERKWLPVEVDLSPWKGTRVQLTLRTLPRDDLSYDWAGWANPVVSVLVSDRTA
jgi:hypothetical protein